MIVTITLSPHNCSTSSWSFKMEIAKRETSWHFAASDQREGRRNRQGIN